MAAVEASAEVISKALDLARPVVDKGCAFLDSLFGKPLAVAGQMFADQVYAWQWRNRIRIAARAQEILREREVDPRILPPGFLMPLLEGAGWTDDADLQELWARLLAGGATDNAAQHPMFIDVLRKMSGVEAQVFHQLAEGGLKAGSSEVGMLVPTGQWVGRTPQPSNVNATAFARLEALGLAKRLESTMFFQPEMMGHLTEFGWDFARAVGVGAGAQRRSAVS